MDTQMSFSSPLNKILAVQLTATFAVWHLFQMKGNIYFVPVLLSSE